MRFAAHVSALLSLAACVWAANITVKVCDGGALLFAPQSVTANQGDIILFQFMSGNHSATQSSFADPCNRLSSGVDSGFQVVPDGAPTLPEFPFPITDATTPSWFFCRQVNHCQSGMVFAVNPTTNQTFDAFKSKATGNSTSTPSSSPGSGYGAAPGLNPSYQAGIITLVVALAAPFL